MGEILRDSLRILQYDVMVQSLGVLGVLDGFGGMLDSERHPTHVNRASMNPFFCMHRMNNPTHYVISFIHPSKQQQPPTTKYVDPNTFPLRRPDHLRRTNQRLCIITLCDGFFNGLCGGQWGVVLYLHRCRVSLGQRRPLSRLLRSCQCENVHRNP